MPPPGDPDQRIRGLRAQLDALVERADRLVAAYAEEDELVTDDERNLVQRTRAVLDTLRNALDSKVASRAPAVAGGGRAPGGARPPPAPPLPGPQRPPPGPDTPHGDYEPGQLATHPVQPKPQWAPPPPPDEPGPEEDTNG